MRLRDSLVRDALAKKHLSQEQFAHQIGVDPSTVSLWLNGKRLPSPESLRRISKELDLEEDQLLDLDPYGVQVHSPNNTIVINNFHVHGGTNFIFPSSPEDLINLLQHDLPDKHQKPKPTQE